MIVKHQCFFRGRREPPALITAQRQGTAFGLVRASSGVSVWTRTEPYVIPGLKFTSTIFLTEFPGLIFSSTSIYQNGRLSRLDAGLASGGASPCHFNACRGPRPAEAAERTCRDHHGKQAQTERQVPAYHRYVSINLPSHCCLFCMTSSGRRAFTPKCRNLTRRS